MPTESEIQKSKKILFDEVGQNDELENTFDELLEIVKKLSPPVIHSVKPLMKLR